MTRYTLDSVRSCIWVSARSSLHPINTETRGVTGWFEAATRDDGALDLDQPVGGELSLAVERLTSGNQLYDRYIWIVITSAVADSEWANMRERSSTLGQLTLTSTATRADPGPDTAWASRAAARP